MLIVLLLPSRTSQPPLLCNLKRWYLGKASWEELESGRAIRSKMWNLVTDFSVLLSRSPLIEKPGPALPPILLPLVHSPLAIVTCLQLLSAAAFCPLWVFVKAVSLVWNAHCYLSLTVFQDLVCLFINIWSFFFIFVLHLLSSNFTGNMCSLQATRNT